MRALCNDHKSNGQKNHEANGILIEIFITSGIICLLARGYDICNGHSYSQQHAVAICQPTSKSSYIQNWLDMVQPQQLCDWQYCRLSN